MNNNLIPSLLIAAAAAINKEGIKLLFIGRVSMDAKYTMGAVIQDHLYQVIGTYKVREKEAPTDLSIQITFQ